MKGCNPYALAALVVERAEVELQTARAGAPGRVAVVPNRPPYEFCDQLWSMVTAIAPRPSRNTTSTSVGACAGILWRVSLTVGVYRCDPSIDKNRPADAPSPVRLDSAARDLMDDAEAVRRAIIAADWALVDVDPVAVTVGNARTTGQQGGGFGVEWDLVVDTELGRYADEAVPMLPGDPRTPKG